MSEEIKPTGTILDLGMCIARPVAPNWKMMAQQAEADAEQAWKTADAWRERALKAEKTLASMVPGASE